MDTRAGLGYEEKKKCLTLPGLKLRTLGRPACSQPLHRLRYPGSSILGHHLNYVGGSRTGGYEEF
jgi:hypothetical protein